MARPTANDRKLDYLQIGAEIVTNYSADEAATAVVDALADVKVAEVAERAGVTKAALYHYWPSQEAYRKDLLGQLLQLSRQRGIREVSEALGKVDLLTENPQEAMALQADAIFRALKDDPSFFARFSFYTYADNPEIGELLRRDDQALTSEFGPDIEMYLGPIGRRLRPPFTVALLLTSISAFCVGLCLSYQTSPELIESDTYSGADAHSMYAFGLDALVTHFSEPIPDPQ